MWGDNAQDPGQSHNTRRIGKGVSHSSQTVWILGSVVVAIISSDVARAERVQTKTQGMVVYPIGSQGNATFVAGRGGGPISVSLPAGRSSAVPMAFLQEYGQVFGVSDPAKELTEVRTEVCGLGQTHTTFQQVFSGVKVFGGILKVHQSAGKEVLAANGHFFVIPDFLNPVPSIASAAAEQIAQAALSAAQLTVEQNE
ncbi:MAG: hypothetical protein ACE5HE_08080, partial [Phycisphaerae bacterium]